MSIRDFFGVGNGSDIRLMYGCPITDYNPDLVKRPDPEQPNPVKQEPGISKELNRIREDMINDTIAKSDVKNILLRYFPIGTTIEITKDYHKIKYPNDIQ